MKIDPIDFETKKIELRPYYPPDPVGVALRLDSKWTYLAWAHKGGGNNISFTDAKRVLKKFYRNSIPLYHNGAFDIKVGMKKMDLPFPKEYHDTLFLAYLYDPREPSLSLKSLAEKHLGWEATEDENLRDWILENTTCKNTKDDPWGAHIWEAPAKLAGPYAIADIKRTWQLYQLYYKDICADGMLEAYNREKKCMPIFEEMSETGVCIDYKRLKKDSERWRVENNERAKKIRRILKVGNDVNIDSGKQLADAMESAGKIGQWVYTEPSERFPDGQRSTSRENLALACNDKKLVALLGDYGKMNTFLGTFAQPWLESAISTGTGRVFPNFNQVRTPDEDGARSYGTRTGRPSSDHPNFLNVPKNQEEASGMPWMRDYVIPDEGGVFLIRDYSQQELRILAHFEEGLLYQAYLDDPNIDVHNLVGELMMPGIYDSKKHRRPVKDVNFGKIYGLGATGTAKKLNVPLDEARAFLKSHERALPGVTDLSKKIKTVTKRGDPIYTWGGRRYYAEEPRIIKGVKRDFYYKMLNYLIQGSGADCTKEAMIYIYEGLKSLNGRLVLQVYDEIVGWAKRKYEREAMIIVKEGMERVKFDIPMLTDGKIGRKSWGQTIKSTI